MNIPAVLLALVLAAAALPAAADAPAAAPAAGAAVRNLDPDALVKSVSNEVLDIIRADKEIQAGNGRKVVELVQTKVLPHFDFERMTALAVGASWRRATPDQRHQLVSEFETLLVRTYSSGLAAYRNQVIDYKPLRSGADDTEVVVKSEVKQPGGQPVTIDYRMEKLTDGWKVFDVSIGGVSLVTTYRDSFGQEVRQNGIDGLIRTLVQKNQQLAQGQSGAR